MRRGDVVTVAATGDYGKPRPAVIVQADALPERHASVVVCPMTSAELSRPAPTAISPFRSTRQRQEHAALWTLQAAEAEGGVECARCVVDRIDDNHRHRDHLGGS
jgi:hypothetical protein